MADQKLNKCFSLATSNIDMLAIISQKSRPQESRLAFVINSICCAIVFAVASIFPLEERFPYGVRRHIGIHEAARQLVIREQILVFPH